ncbi:hypothetical protein SAY87_020535 [Trapa incisa]|uniref:Uncharacterized protein n=1 Tax=Trapa incisa TaxID=236973 RepID=A0AAN7JQC3_9MYRT|nr:hypothetical protein SAY87_020535 [Trapa incisa]
MDDALGLPVIDLSSAYCLSITRPIRQVFYLLLVFLLLWHFSALFCSYPISRCHGGLDGCFVGLKFYLRLTIVSHEGYYIGPLEDPMAQIKPNQWLRCSIVLRCTLVIVAHASFFDFDQSAHAF